MSEVGLPPGAKMSHAVAEESIDGIKMKPIHFSDSLNSDDVGHFIAEGAKQVLNQNNKRRTVKTSKVSTSRKVRQVSSMWR